MHSWVLTQSACVRANANTNANEEIIHVVSVKLFMALAAPWKGIVVFRVSVQTLFIIIIIIIINHPSSSVPGLSNAPNH